MANLNLIDQQTYANQVAPKINRLKLELDKRKDIWKRLPTKKRVRWIKSGKDPIMTLAWQMHKYLRNNFFGEQEENEHG